MSDPQNFGELFQDYEDNKHKMRFYELLLYDKIKEGIRELIKRKIDELESELEKELITSHIDSQIEILKDLYGVIE